MRITTPTLALLLMCALSVPGCLYSKQQYGPPGVAGGFGQKPSPGEPLQDVITKYGAPDRVLEYGDTQVLLWQSTEGMQVLGAYAKIQRFDLVVIGYQGKVEKSEIVAKGQGEGILMGPYLGPFVEVH